MILNLRNLWTFLFGNLFSPAFKLPLEITMMKTFRRVSTSFVFLVAAGLIAGCDKPIGSSDTGATDTPEKRTHHKKANAHEHDDKANVPEKVMTVLEYIDEHHKAPEGHVGGREFHNGGRSGEQVLPRHDSAGKAVTYQEWDVNAKVKGVNRGTERLITGSDGSAYYTDDHYKTFKKIR